MRGAITGGDSTEGAELFTVHSEHTPEHAVRLTAMTDAGPVVVAVSTAGVASIGAGPFLGSGAVLLDSLSWPSGVAVPRPDFTGWGQTDIFFGDEALDVSYGELD